MVDNINKKLLNQVDTSWSCYHIHAGNVRDEIKCEKCDTVQKHTVHFYKQPSKLYEVSNEYGISFDSVGMRKRVTHCDSCEKEMNWFYTSDSLKTKVGHTEQCKHSWCDECGEPSMECGCACECQEIFGGYVLQDHREKYESLEELVRELRNAIESVKTCESCHGHFRAPTKAAVTCEACNVRELVLGNRAIGDDPCPICREVIEACHLYTTKCRHRFHLRCRRDAVRNDTDKCPLCRTKW